MTTAERKTQACWAYLVETFPLWPSLWKCKVMEYGQEEAGLWEMLDCRDEATWIRWNHFESGWVYPFTK